MIDLDLKFPDWSDHPPAPKLSFAEYEAWVLGFVLPRLAAAGKWTPEAIREDFRERNGTMTEPFVYHED